MYAHAELKAKIIAGAKEIGIDKIGFTTAADFSHLKPSLEEQKANGHTTGFEHRNIDERLYPELIFDQPKSIIAICLAYPTQISEKPVKTTNKRGSFARASWGEDYHFILRDKMTKLIDFIKAAADDDTSFTFKPMVDTGELIDVAVAQRAGLGFIGLNGLLITQEFGSYVYLGEIMTNIEFEPDTPIENRCGTCTRCIDFCPPSALMGDGRMNAPRCLSYQTQTKGFMPEEFRPQIRSIIYGCDICQQVCPYNKGKNFHFHPAMEPKPDEVMPELKPLLTMTNKEFKAQFGRLAGSWRGRKPIQRNAIIALANYHDRTAIPDLLRVIEEDPRPVLRGTAAWAVAQIERHPNDDLMAFMQDALTKEDDVEAQAEFTQAIRVLQEKI